MIQRRGRGRKRKRNRRRTIGGSQGERPIRRRRLNIQLPDNFGEANPFADRVENQTKFLRRKWARTLLHKQQESKEKVNPIEKEPIYKQGLIKLKGILKFCLVVVAKDLKGNDLYPFSNLQFTAFMKQIPTFLPLIFGVSFFSQYKEELHHVLGTLHQKLCFVWIGARRDGKSMLAAISMAALVLHCPTDKFSMAIMGSSGDCAERMLGNIGQVLNWGVVVAKYGKKFKHKINKRSVYVRNMGDSKDIKEITSHAPTDNQLRGTNKSYDCGDELTRMPKEFFMSQCAGRYGENLGSTFISNANPSEPFFDKFKKSTIVVELLNQPRICEDCKRECRANTGNDTLHAAMVRCWERNHVEPPDNDWVDQENVKGWSFYQTDEVLAREANLGDFLGKAHQFPIEFIDKVFRTWGETFDGEFEWFTMGIDPSDKGLSELGISVYGYRNSVYYLLFQHNGRVTDEQNIPKIIFGATEAFVQGAKIRGWIKTEGINRFNLFKQKMYVWVESPGHHGYDLQALYDTHENMGQFCRVMKALEYDKKSKKFSRYCIAKTEEITEDYVWCLNWLARTNRLRIHKGYFTFDPRHRQNEIQLKAKAEETRLTFQRQCQNYVRTDKNKIQAKNKKNGGKDDILISALMPPYNMERAMHPYHLQPGKSRLRKEHNKALMKQVYQWTVNSII